MKYRSKPVVKEAVQYDQSEESWNAIIEMGCELKQVDRTENGTDPWTAEIETLEGVMKVSLGDYIIKGLRGEFYPCKPDIFEKSYEPVEETQGAE